MGKKNKRSKINNENRSFEIDMEELKLLNYQVIASLIILYSDILLYKAANEINENNIEACILIRIQAQAYGLISRIIFLWVDFTRYSNLYERYINEEINYSLQPNIDINIGDIFGVLIFYYGLFGDLGIYENNIQYDSETIELIRERRHSTIIHFYGNIFLLVSSLQSIQLVRSKYLKDKRNIPNPDITAIFFAVINEIARILFVNTELKIFNDIYMKYQNGEFQYTLIPNFKLVLSSIFSLIQSYYILKSILGICDRHRVQPVFVA